MNKRSRTLGIVLHYVIRTGQKYGNDPQTETRRFGPYSSLDAAECFRREDEEAAGATGWEYSYRIESEPNLPSK